MTILVLPTSMDIRICDDEWGWKTLCVSGCWMLI